MRGTALIYSSHDRSNYIHNDLIVQRALEGRDNKRILFLPMSEGIQNGNELERQDFSWGRFEWFFNYYRHHGLEAFPFFWRSGLRKEDVEQLWHNLYHAQVVILGGGHSATGMNRYRQLGAHFDGEPGKFGRILHERAQRGLLTVGFSAGADQMSEYLFRGTQGASGDNRGFGMARNTLVTLHHDASRDSDLKNAAWHNRHCMVFGLPNDAGLNVSQGMLASGNWWQVIEFVVDNSWDDKSDFFHIKTRQGAKIDNFRWDGAHWGFGGGDYLVRVQSPDNQFHEAWMTQHGRLLNYWTRQPSRFHSIREVLENH